MTLNEAYDEYQRTKDLEALYPFVKQRAAQAVVSVLHRAAPEDLVVTLTTNVLMDLEKFKPGKSAFASWVFLKAKHDCMDELRRGEQPYIDPIVDEAGAVHFQRWAFDGTLDPPEDAEATEADDSLIDLYTRIETVLDPEEKELVRLKFEGFQGEEIAEVLNISHENVRQRFAALKKKLQKAA